jgi:phosphatidylinositol alpha-mannosyltransferase
VKVGIVVPYSFSFWGGVIEHAEEQARALADLGVDARILAGHDARGRLSRLLHPTAGRFEPPPEHVIPLGRSVIAPANHSLANVVLSPAAVLRLRRALARERFDLLHVHEPLAPALGVAALAYADVPLVATFHAAGASRWRALARPLWGFLLERVDLRIAVSEAAAATAEAYSPGSYRLLPNGVRLPRAVALDGRAAHAVFVGRHEPRKGLSVLLRAWPAVHRRTGARLRIVGADHGAVRLLLGRQRLPETGIDILGPLPSGELDAELATAKLLVAPSLGRESFGMVLTRAFASATPVVASDIDGYRQLVAAGGGLLVPPGAQDELERTLVTLLTDEPLRRRLGRSGRELAVARYGWPKLAVELRDLYEDLVDARPRSPGRSEAAA